MATVELSFTPLPAHVRTARLVATAVARRSRVDETLLDEVRLAVGEACSRAVEAHRLHCPAEPVRIQLSNREGRFEVVVIDTVPSGADDPARAGEHATASGGGTDPVPAGVSAAPAAGAAPAPSPGAAPPPGAGGWAGSAAAGPSTEAIDGLDNGRLPADIGLAVIQGLVDDVQISATAGGVSIRMSWPLSPAG